MLQGFLQSASEMAAAARVTRCQGGAVDASGAGMYRAAPLFGPYGVCGIPPEGETALFLPMDDSAVCAGVLCAQGGLQPGELELRSAGGARIVLKNSGEIELNGLVITSDGRLVERGSV